MDATDFHSMEGENTMEEVNGVHQLSGYSYSSKYLLLFSAKKRKKKLKRE